MSRSASFLFTLVCFIFAGTNLAHAEFKVEISGVGITQIPIAVSDFRGQESSPQKIAGIITADLERSGQFKSSPTGVLLDENSHPDFNTIKQNNIDAVLTGSITK